MTDLWTNMHHEKCPYYNMDTKIINLNLSNSEATLECGCVVNIHLSKLITII